jgi:hypothetical protein
VLFRVDTSAKQATKVSEATFAELKVLERYDLQQWILSTPELLGENLLVITTECDRFDRTLERLDVLAVDEERSSSSSSSSEQRWRRPQTFKRFGTPRIAPRGRSTIWLPSVRASSRSLAHPIRQSMGYAQKSSSSRLCSKRRVWIKAKDHHCSSGLPAGDHRNGALASQLSARYLVRAPRSVSHRRRDTRLFLCTYPASRGQGVHHPTRTKGCAENDGRYPITDGRGVHLGSSAGCASFCRATS